MYKLLGVSHIEKVIPQTYAPNAFKPTALHPATVLTLTKGKAPHIEDKIANIIPNCA